MGATTSSGPRLWTGSALPCQVVLPFEGSSLSLGAGPPAYCSPEPSLDLTVGVAVPSPLCLVLSALCPSPSLLTGSEYPGSWSCAITRPWPGLTPSQASLVSVASQDR